MQRMITGADGRLPLRYPVTMPADIQERGSCPLPITIVDLSVDRCRLWGGFRLKPGHDATLRIDGFAQVKTTIIWCADLYAELVFATALHWSILNHLVARHPVAADQPTDAITAQLDRLSGGPIGISAASGR